jgi:hypothetical protein
MTLELAPEAPHAMPLIRSQGVGTLERLLDAGWRIEPPVLARLAWSQRDAEQCAYHFILKRDAQRSLVVIADSPELQQFIAVNAIAVA